METVPQSSVPPLQASYTGPPAKPISLQRRTNILLVFQGLTVVFALACAGFGINLISFISNADHAQKLKILMGETDQETMVNVMYFFWFVAWFLTLIPYSFWVYRANKNARIFGAADLKHSPGWAVGWTFIPLANAIKPFSIMHEIWKASTNPDDWKNQSASTLVGWSWVFMFLGGVSERIAMRFYGDLTTVDEHLIEAVGSTITITLFSLYGLFLFIYFIKVNRLQNNLIRSRGYMMPM